MAWLVISLGIILVGAETFTNGVEWFGQRLRLGAGAVGSILAAVGTALPETMIPIIAFAGGKEEDLTDIGIGAILGAPFMLATLAFFISALAVIAFRRSVRPMTVDQDVVRRDLVFFMAAYSIAIAASFLPWPGSKNLCALVLIIFYIYYVFKTVRSSVGRQEYGRPPNLYLARSNSTPGLQLILIQIALALLAIVSGAHWFVQSVQSVAIATGVPVFALSLIITPVATELPEKFNSVLWLGRGKDTLAIGNITGAMVFQSSVIPALGMTMTSWKLDSLALLSALFALVSALVPYLALKRWGSLSPLALLAGGGFYLLFLLQVVRLN